MKTSVLFNSLELKGILEEITKKDDSGSLIISNPYLMKRFNFNNRQITAWSTSNKERQMGSLGFALLQLGVVSSQELLNAFMEQRSKKKHYCEILCEKGLISRDDIQLAATCVVSEEICEIFTWEEGKIEVASRHFPSTTMYGNPYIQSLELAVPVAIITEKIGTYMEEWSHLCNELNNLQLVLVMNNTLVKELQEYIESSIAIFDGVKEVAGVDKIFDSSITQRVQKDLAFFNGKRILKDIVPLIASDRIQFCRLVLDLIHRNYLRALGVEDLLLLAEFSRNAKDLGEAKKYYQVLLTHSQLPDDKRDEIDRLLSSANLPPSIERTAVIQAENLELDFPGYEIVQEIGKGAMGKVYKALQKSLNRYVAIKVVPPIFSSNEMYIKRLELEAKAMARLKHPNIVGAIDFGFQKQHYYIIMEYVEGGKTLRNIIDEKTKLNEKEVLEMGFAMSNALKYLHEHLLVHRDIKPANILIDHDGTPKLADLGLIKDTQVDLGLTMPGTSVGTPAYMSPEQLQTQKDIDIRSDIYSLGATLLHALTGRSRFGDTVSVGVIYHKIVSEQDLHLKAMGNISDAMNNILTKMLQPRREDRYQNPTELLEDFKLVLAGQQPQTASRPLKKGAGKFGLIAAAVILLLAGIAGVVLWQTNIKKTKDVTAEDPQKILEEELRKKLAEAANKPPEVTAPPKVFKMSLEKLWVSTAAEKDEPKAEEFDVKRLVHLHLVFTVDNHDEGSIFFHAEGPHLKTLEQEIQQVPVSGDFHWTVPVAFEKREGHQYSLEVLLKRKEVTVSQKVTFTLKKLMDDLLYLGKNKQNYEEYQRERDGMVMILIPAGDSEMGDTTDQGYPDEKRHMVTLDAFLIDKYEVANAQYGKFLDWWKGAWSQDKTKYDWPIPKAFKGKLVYDGDHTPKYWSDAKYNKPDQPVVGVDWFDAYAYAAWANNGEVTENTGYIPSEAQWEKAARWNPIESKAAIYPWVGEPDPQRANFLSSGNQFPIAVNTYPDGASHYGTQNMAGNVAEWCMDWYNTTFYQNSPKENPVNMKATKKGKVYRGGSFKAYGWDLRSSRRSFTPIEMYSVEIGFRTCRPVPKGQ